MENENFARMDLAIVKSEKKVCMGKNVFMAFSVEKKSMSSSLTRQKNADNGKQDS